MTESLLTKTKTVGGKTTHTFFKNDGGVQTTYTFTDKQLIDLLNREQRLFFQKIETLKALKSLHEGIAKATVNRALDVIDIWFQRQDLYEPIYRGIRADIEKLREV